MRLPRVSGRSLSKNILTFTRRVFRLPSVLRPRERTTISVLLIIIVLFATISIFGSRGVRPAYGGTFTEGFVGQPRFVNPILATSDIDQSLSKLIYSGLTKINALGRPEPDLASSWDVEDSGRKYVFHMRQGVYWQDGQKVTATDVVHTVDLIKDPTLNSLYYDSWKDISAEVSNEDTVIFQLKDPFTTFPWLTTVGIVPAHIDRHALSTTFIGTGPYKYSKVRMRSGQIDSLVLIRNTKWYGGHLPYVDAVEFWFYANQVDAEHALLGQKILAMAGSYPGAGHLNGYTLPLSEQLTLFLNSQSKLLSDSAVRKKILQTEDQFSPPISLTMVVDSSHIEESALQSLLDQWKKRNIIVTINPQSLDIIKKTVLPGRTYDAIAVAIENGPEADPYAYWHSSQADGSGLNFARIKNNDLDKLLVDQRRATDLNERDMTLVKIDQLIQGIAVSKLLSRTEEKYSISKSVHVQMPKQGQTFSDRFGFFDQWYIKTRR